MPHMYAIYIYSILKKKGLDVEYAKLPKNEYEKKKYEIIKSADYIIVPSSIIASETESEVIRDLTNESKKIFVVGIFSSVLREKYKTKNSYIVPGEPEDFFLKISYEKENETKTKTRPLDSKD